MLGANVASQMSITVRALRRIGVEADGVIYETNSYCSTVGLRNFALGLSRKDRLRTGYLRTSWSWGVASALLRADVVHWNYAMPVWRNSGDVRLARLLRRTGAVEFWGSDVRIGDRAEIDNPYYARRGAEYEYLREETEAASYRRQEAFAANGVRTCFAPPWFDRYVKPGLFDTVHGSFLRVLLDEFPVVSCPKNRRPLVVHAPSARGAKGTTIVEQVLERLRSEFDFEFLVLHRVPRHEVLDIVKRCDLFLDQFVIGEYGMASIEAMAFGKPVVCYLRQDVIERSPGKLPIVNATQDDLYDCIASLLVDPERRRAIGEASRRYVEAFHDAEAYARRLVPLYERMLADRA
jgi:hypothetical protein